MPKERQCVRCKEQFFLMKCLECNAIVCSDCAWSHYREGKEHSE